MTHGEVPGEPLPGPALPPGLPEAPIGVLLLLPPGLAQAGVGEGGERGLLAAGAPRPAT